MARSQLQALVLIGLCSFIQSAQLRSGLSSAGPPLQEAVVQRSLEEAAIAKSASEQAKASAQSAAVHRQNYVSAVSTERAKEVYDKIAPKVTEARAATLKTRTYSMIAGQHAQHAIEVAMAARHIPEFAAERSKEAVLGWIKEDAKQAAERSVISPKEAARANTNKLSREVAAAAEPYHLALLRNQKFSAEAYSKAKSAQKSSQKLQTEAKVFALKAQTLQASGMGVEAQEMMAAAHAMMQEAENMRQWGSKLYSQANAANSATSGYTLSEHQAATNIAGA